MQFTKNIVISITISILITNTAQANYIGSLSANPYAHNSTSNPNSQYHRDSPNNPYGNGMRIIGN